MPINRDRLPIRSKQTDKSKRNKGQRCPNCGNPGPHLVPASLGESSFYICDAPNWDKTINDVKPKTQEEKLREAGFKPLDCTRCKANIRQQALIEGIIMYAWWKDGIQYVGTTGRTLKEAIAKIRESD